ncbi:autophagy-related protein 22-like protein [Leptodontidium sp. 2 PMI_412]|nr:autophagy-related protein 22-like protein [Leptodontidium sp. 2 PMI_412]
MGFPLVAWWKKDTALNTYIFGLFLIGLPFTLFATYVVYQLQVVGFMIGADSDGLPCMTYCLVPFGSQKLDLNSVILYLNALGFGLGGVVAVFIAAYADFWKEKSTLVAIFVVCYGIVCIPVYWLRDTSIAAFNALMALYVVYAVISYILSVLFCIFIPHCMRTAVENEAINAPNSEQASNQETKTPNDMTTTLEDGASATKTSASRKYGFKMSIFGSFGTAVGGIIALIIVIILIKTLPDISAQSAGLLVTTIVGFITVLGAIVTYLGLPAVPAKPKDNWKAWWIELFTPLKDLSKRKNMAVLLLSYTIYVDTVFALNSVTGQLYYVQVLPDTLEFTLYSMAFTIFGAVTTLAFYLLQVWRPPFRLEYWLVIGYAIILIIPIWGCIGFVDNIDFGFKNRWEFYIQSLLFNVSNSIVNSVFRVLFSEMVPKGSEVEWFGLQVILSCATAWVSYVANAPLQNATHELRFPLVLCLIMLVLPVVLEICRCSMDVFVKDKARWKEYDESDTSGSADES